MSEEDFSNFVLKVGIFYEAKIKKLFNNLESEENKDPNEFYSGQIVYIGKRLRKGLSNRHTLAINGKLGVRIYSFKDYEVKDEKIVIKEVRELETNALERVFLNQQFLKAKKREDSNAS